MVRWFSLVLLASAAALLDVSVLPWLPVLHTIAPISVVGTMIALRFPTRFDALVVLLVAGTLREVLRGDVVGVAFPIFIAAFIMVRSVGRPLALRKDVVLGITIALIVTLADRLVLSIVNGSVLFSLRTLVQLLAACGWSVVGAMVVLFGKQQSLSYGTLRRI